jgi:hypothetical protein
LIPETVDAQRWPPTQAKQTAAIRVEIDTNCQGLGDGGTAILLPLPIVDPGYAVPSLISLVYPESKVVRASPNMPAPGRQDCVLNADDGVYKATSGDDINPEDFWVFDAQVSCPNALSPQEAGLRVGEKATVTGSLADVRTNLRADAAFLALEGSRALVRITGVDAADAFIIWQQAGRGSQICVTGNLEAFRGALVIDVTSAADVGLARDQQT